MLDNLAHYFGISGNTAKRSFRNVFLHPAVISQVSIPASILERIKKEKKHASVEGDVFFSENERKWSTGGGNALFW